MGDDCLFCKIANGEIKSEMFYEDDQVVVFLDVFPVATGHALIVPKKHYDTLNNTPDSLLARLMSVSKKTSQAITRAFDCDGINLFQNNGKAAGQEIQHIHFHILPRFSDDKIAFRLEQKPYKGNYIKQVRQKIADHWDAV